MNLIGRLFARSAIARIVLLLLVLVPVVALSACKAKDAGDGGRSAAEHEDHDDDDVRKVDAAMLERGRGVYTANCAPCHGATGKGDGTAAASLDPKPRDHSNRTYMDTLTDESIAEVVKIGGALRGFPNMPSHPHIGGEDMVALVAYVRTLSRGSDGVQVVALDID
jgi:mono/diheme cytochrome c family protein